MRELIRMVCACETSTIRCTGKKKCCGNVGLQKKPGETKDELCWGLGGVENNKKILSLHEHIAFGRSE